MPDKTVSTVNLDHLVSHLARQVGDPTHDVFTRDELRRHLRAFERPMDEKPCYSELVITREGDVGADLSVPNPLDIKSDRWRAPVRFVADGYTLKNAQLSTITGNVTHHNLIAGSFMLSAEEFRVFLTGFWYNLYLAARDLTIAMPPSKLLTSIAIGSVRHGLVSPDRLAERYGRLGALLESTAGRVIARA